jgi:hypothetical protein
MRSTTSLARLRLIGTLQWFGTLAGAATWTGQHIVGYGIGQAKCVSGGMHWDIGNDVWQLTLMACSGLVVVAAAAASTYVFLQTRGADFGDGPPAEDRFEGKTPYGRLHFFAAAGMAANVVFLGIILLDGFAATFDTLCRQS